MDTSGASSVSSDRSIDIDDVSIDILKKKTFLGHFIEKKFVPSIQHYRDLIIFNPPDDQNFSLLLAYVQDRLHKQSPLKWIGITIRDSVNTDSITTVLDNTPYSWIVWTKLPKDIPFGEYHFQVKNISFKHKEIYLKLQIVFDRNGSAESVAPVTAPIQFTSHDLLNAGRGLIEGVREQFRIFIGWVRTQEITPETIWITLKYVAVILMMAGALSIEVIKMVGRFALLMCAEIRKFIVVLMPLLLRLVGLVEKCIGGIFILIAMVWRDTVYGISGKPTPRRNVYQPIDNRPHRMRYN